MKLSFYKGDVSESRWKVNTSDPIMSPGVREKMPSLSDGV